jgi:hypothetical protein
MDVTGTFGSQETISNLINLEKESGDDTQDKAKVQEISN